MTILGDDFRAWFEGKLKPMHETAREAIKRGQAVRPAIWCFSHADDVTVIPIPMETIADKNRVARLVAMLGTQDFVAGAIMVSEVWILDVAKHEQSEVERIRRSREGIANHPDRRDVVMWNAVKGERQLIAMARINRERDDIGPVEILDPRKEMLTGRMALDEAGAKRRGH